MNIKILVVPVLLLCVCTTSIKTTTALETLEIEADSIKTFNSQLLFKNYNATICAQLEFDEAVKQFEIAADSIRLTATDQDYKLFVEEMMGINGKLPLANKAYVKIIIDTLNTQLELFRKENAIDMLVDLSNYSVAFADPKFGINTKSIEESKNAVQKFNLENLLTYQNITDTLLNQLNSKFEAQPYLSCK